MSSRATSKKPNKLIHETSPYLLQHAYNPVQWMAFGEEAFEKARAENKPMLISIGYSACHWCHVMEHECFEDEQAAALMNENFINVKVDREERSDVDMLYMQAVQLMTGHGGWPLNCFVLPNGKPFYGGTYFPKSQWLTILSSLSNLYTNDLGKVQQYAEELSKGIVQTEEMVSKNKAGGLPDRELLRDMISKWKKRLDTKEGGPNKAPKFPMPNNYLFLLRYAVLEKDQELLKHVELTLTKMALGGIYDQVRGGFCRYSTDTLWKVPHFEKMLYDNAQLVSLYSEAYLHTKNELYKQIVLQTCDFIEKEWYTNSGSFYSAYDADSEGVEGKYYVWSKRELRDLLKDDFDLFSGYFEINEKGYWEDENYILMRKENTLNLLSERNLYPDQLKAKIDRCLKILEQEAEKRVKPGLDDKTITSWNALMCSGFAHAYLAFGLPRHKEIALSSLQFIKKSLTQPDGKLYRTYKNGQAKINGFLDDYAFTIEAYVNCYLLTQDEKLLHEAKKLTKFSLALFENTASEFLYYTDRDAKDLVTKTTETQDNVIPASNSEMAVMLFMLGKLFDEVGFEEKAVRMLSNMQDELTNYGPGYSNWANLALHFAYPSRELAIVGKNVDEKFQALYKHGLTNTIFGLSAEPSELPLLRDRYMEQKTMIYVCENKSCKLPVTTIEDALEQLA